MGETPSSIFVSRCQTHLAFSLSLIGRDHRLCEVWLKKKHDQRVVPRRAVVPFPRRPAIIKSQKAFSSFSYTSVFDVPIKESAGALFDLYMEDRARIVQAIFPHNKSRQLSEEEWRIQLPPMQVLFLTFWPIVDTIIRCKSNGEDYPPQVPIHITKLLEAHLTRWEIGGLHRDYWPSNVKLDVRVTLYPERRGTKSWLKNRIEMNIIFSIPPRLIGFMPEMVLRSIIETVLKTMVEGVKHEAKLRLLADYNDFKKGKLIKNLI